MGNFAPTRFDTDERAPLPDPLQGELQAYFQHGHVPENLFLQAVLANDLRSAIRYGGGYCPVLPDLIRFLSAHAPQRAWGRAEYLAQWEQMGGLTGLAFIKRWAHNDPF